MSSDSEDLDGFESAEEEVSDLDEEELERILAQDEPAEAGPGLASQGQSAGTLGQVKPPSLAPRDEATAVGPGLVPPGRSEDVPSQTKPLDNTRPKQEFKHVNASPDNPNIDSRPSSNRNVSDKIKEISHKTEDSASNGWDFEDDDISLNDSPAKKDAGPSSSKSSIEESNIKKTDNTHTEDKGLDFETSQTGWNFDEDLIDPEVSDNANCSPKKEQPSSSQQNTTSNQVWPSWNSWGVTNLLSSAAEGVTAVNPWSQVTSGLTGLTSMLENTLGAPDPQVLASQLTSSKGTENPQDNNPSKEANAFEGADIFGLGSILGGVKQLGNKVIDGGLGTLETLGKKTMEVLQEGDPGLKKKRALLFQGDKVVLSQVLRDAKEKAEASEEEYPKISRKAQYETLFDDFHGLVHLEALEMISRQCEVKMQSLLSNSHKCSLQEFNDVVNSVKNLYEKYEEEKEKEDESDEDFQTILDSSMDALSLQVNVKNFIEVNISIHSRLKQEFLDGPDIHSHAISDLAQFTACSIELFHRLAELFIVKDKSNVENDFKALSRIACISKCKIGEISESYSAKLMVFPDKANSPLITNIFLEASNSSTYLDNAFELFIPILQLKALQNEISSN